MKTDEKRLTVRQANSLIEASYKIASIGEGRLIRMLIAQIEPSDDDFKTYRIAVADFASIFGLSGGSAYGQIKKAADDLTSRKIRIEKGKDWLFMNWLSSAEYREGTGYVELCFDKKLKPYLLQLKGYFTQYQLERIVTFKGIYSMRLFELLKTEQFKASDGGQFKRTFDYEELRAKLGVPSSEYRLFADFRINVLQTAIREINANPDIHITQVDYPKTGRKVSHVVFHCERAKQTQLDLDGPPPRLEEVPKEQPDYIKELVLMGIDEVTALKWKKKYGVRQVVRNIGFTKAMQKAGKIRDSVTGFLARAIADNLGGGWEEEEKRREEERKARDQAERARIKAEKEKADAEVERFAGIEASFNARTEAEKEAIRKAYFEQMPVFLRRFWESAKEKGERPESRPTVRASFLAFYNSTANKNQL